MIFYIVKKPLNSHENIYTFYKKKPTYNIQMREGYPYEDKRRKSNSKGEHMECRPNFKIKHTGVYNGRYPLSVLNFKREHKSKHPTQKPVALLEWLIKTYTNENEIV